MYAIDIYIAQALIHHIKIHVLHTSPIVDIAGTVTVPGQEQGQNRLPSAKTTEKAALIPQHYNFFSSNKPPLSTSTPNTRTRTSTSIAPYISLCRASRPSSLTRPSFSIQPGERHSCSYSVICLRASTPLLWSLPNASNRKRAICLPPLRQEQSCSASSMMKIVLAAFDYSTRLCESPSSRLRSRCSVSAIACPETLDSIGDKITQQDKK